LAGSIDYFVSDASGSRGPLSSDAARAALGDSTEGVRVRVEGCEPWLPAEAWEAFADLGRSSIVPSPPPAGAATQLPEELTSIAPSVRDRLMWFVADADGVMGPFSGEYVKRGLATSKFKGTAGVCVVSTEAWARAAIVFPGALEAATDVRPRLAVVSVCQACLEPCMPGDATCGACGEPLAVPPPTSRVVTLALVALAWAVVFGASALAARLVLGARPF
jgi:hypothetical protein